LRFTNSCQFTTIPHSFDIIFVIKELGAFKPLPLVVIILKFVAICIPSLAIFIRMKSLIVQDYQSLMCCGQNELV